MEINYTKDFIEALIQHGKGRKPSFLETVLYFNQKVSAQRYFMMSLCLCKGPRRMKQVWVCLSLPVYQIIVQDMDLCL